MKLKNGLLIASVLLIGTVSAQENPPVPVPPPPPSVSTTPVVQAEIIDFPDVEAEFPGGPEALKKYIQDNVHYPEKARKNGDQGRVYVTFIVEPDGSITGVEAMRGGVSPEINREAKRLVRNMPKWKAAEVKNKKVRARCRLPITFTLALDDDDK
ncbi:MAG: energy transducer TonB [Crocinitomicaceae bacterium]|nr:energy transducer TonB [Crocinitomicaceae bacterium]